MIHNPRWLAAITVRHGQPEYDEPDLNAHRWQWLEGDCGVRIDRNENSWAVFIWSTMRSVTLRTAVEPSATDIAQAAVLVGLMGPGATGLARASFTSADLVREAS